MLPSLPPPRLNLNQVVEDFLGRKSQDSGRLNELATYCVHLFEDEGLAGMQGGSAGEAGIRGLVRNKNWDLAYLFAGKPRLLISLKSILRNIKGTVPNRLDDLMGEAANVQQYTPEVVTGYIIVLDEKGNSMRRDGVDWITFMENSLEKIAIRKAPLWNQGIIEGVWTIRIDSRLPAGQQVINYPKARADGQAFAQALLTELHQREPAIKIQPPKQGGTS